MEVGFVWGGLSCEVTQNGFTLPAEDSMIEATAKHHQLTRAGSEFKDKPHPDRAHSDVAGAGLR